MKTFINSLVQSSLVLIAAFFTMYAGAYAYADDAAIVTNKNCKIRIQNIDQKGDNKYDPLSRYDYLEPLQIRITNIGTSNCNGRLTFERGSTVSEFTGISGDQLNYLLLDQHNINKVLFNSSSADIRSVGLNLKRDDSIILKPRLYISRGQSANSGIYSANIDAVFIRNGSRNVEDRISVNLSAYVRASVQANFSGVSRQGREDRASLVRLGELEPGLRKTVGLQLRSNTHVDVTISSENQGELAHKNISHAGIAYNLSVGGQMIDLSSTDEMVLPTSIDAAGATSPIEVELENYSQAPAGKYEDVLHFRISAR